MSLPENMINFNEVERAVQKMCNEHGCGLLSQILEKWDAQLAASYDSAQYRDKGTRRSTIKTVLGEVVYRRKVYITTDEQGINRCVYPLDEAIGKSGSGLMSGLLSEMIVQASCESSYRSAARAVSEMTGQAISHTAAWNVVQSLGEGVDATERSAAKLAVDSKGAGQQEAKLLFEEMDGIWLHLQGKSRKTYGESKEMKLSIAYDGAKKTGKNRYELTGKVACANFEPGAKFLRRKEGVIASVYNTDEVEMRFLGGDGASWIKGGITDDAVHFQLDTFHRNRAVLQYVSDPAARKIIFKLLYAKQAGFLLDVIEALADSSDDEDVRQDFLRLLEYFRANKEALVPCHRRGIDVPAPPKGKEYRRLGAMESNVFTILGNRMKGRRACWSINGGNNLARLLCLKFTDRLSKTLHSLSVQTLPERYALEVPIILSAKVPSRVGKGYNGYHQMSVPSSMKWLKEIAAIKPLWEI